MQTGRVNRRFLGIGALFVLGLGGAIGAVTEKARSGAAPPAVAVRPAATAALAVGLSEVVKRELPAVVNISTSKTVKIAADEGSLFNDPMFRRFFGEQGRNPMRPHSQKEHALGSGVIVSKDGYLLTNSHVVDKATQIDVTLSDKREFKARLVGADPKTDIAVLKIDATNLPTLTFADSSRVQVGDYALAIGNPFGVGQTVTLGIVSAKGRGNLGIEEYEDFIQTDAAINPGNSGGALVNSQGDLVGIKTASISPNSGGNNGVGFAIPSNLAHSVTNQLVNQVEVQHAFTAVTLQPGKPALAQAFGLSGSRGALVGDVSPNTPASRAGLQSGDVIVEFNGEPVMDSNQLRNNVSMMAPGTSATLKVIRDGHERQVPVTLGDMPANLGSLKGEKGSGNEQSGSGMLEGVSVQEITKDARQSLNLPASVTGVVVVSVDSD